jgi:hypothetical protein
MVGPVPAASTLVAEKPTSVVAPGYIQLSGTSFAAPIVAGAAAQILAAHPTWTPDQVKGALMVTASRTPSAAPLSQGVGIVDVAKAVALSSAPNPNAPLNRFITTDAASGKSFDAASWASTASANASWASASWSDASWASASWNSASWASASWASASWASASWASDSQSAASWASASWASASWSDNAETEAPSDEGEYLDDAELAEFAAALGLDPATDAASTDSSSDPADTAALPLP